MIPDASRSARTAVPSTAIARCPRFTDAQHRSERTTCCVTVAGSNACASPWVIAAIAPHSAAKDFAKELDEFQVQFDGAENEADQDGDGSDQSAFLHSREQAFFGRRGRRSEPGADSVDKIREQSNVVG